eukprot:2494882-Heterocapsa_arctica.AAC.1
MRSLAWSFLITPPLGWKLLQLATDEAAVALERFQGARQKIKVMFTDNAPEMVKAISLLKARHDTSTPYRSTTNAVAERMVRQLLEGARTILEMAGLSSVWWPHA